MTTELPTNPGTTMTPSDEQIVQDLLPSLSTSPSEAQIAPDSLLNEQRRLAWERDQATIADFFNYPFKYISAYWQQYKPIVIALPLIALAIIAVNFVLMLLGFILAIPLMGSLLQLIGFVYSIWFVKRYLLTPKTRQELSEKVAQIKQAVIGTTEEIVGDANINNILEGEEPKTSISD